MNPLKTTSAYDEAMDTFYSAKELRKLASELETLDTDERFAELIECARNTADFHPRSALAFEVSEKLYDALYEKTLDFLM